MLGMYNLYMKACSGAVAVVGDFLTENFVLLLSYFEIVQLASSRIIAESDHTLYGILCIHEVHLSENRKGSCMHMYSWCGLIYYKVMLFLPLMSGSEYIII